MDMEDDLVTRIEEHLHGNMKNTSEFLLTLAADEIERLREMVDTFHKLAKHFYEQAVRGE